MSQRLPDKYYNSDGSVNYYANDVFIGTFYGYDGVEEAYAAHWAKYGKRPKKPSPKAWYKLLRSRSAAQELCDRLLLTVQELNTLLWNAVAASDVSRAKRLRKQGASVHTKGPDAYGGCSLLALACKQGCLAMIQFLLRCGAKAKQDLVGFANDSTNPDRLKIMEALLKHGAKAQYWGGDKILLGSCRYHGEFELLKVLLKADVATSARANKGVCPLVTACTYKNWPAAELLLKRRKDKVDNVDEQGRTPLMLACKAGQTDLVKSLLKRNANVKAHSREGLQAHQYAKCADIAKLVETKGRKATSARR